MTVLRRRAIFLSSKDRRAGDKNKFSIAFEPEMLRAATEPGTYLRVWVSQLTARFDFSSVTENNNCLEKNGQLIKLRRGNPNIYNVLSDLGSYGIHAIYDQPSNRLTFTGLSSYTLNFDVPNSAADLLGFNRDAYSISLGSRSPELVKLGVFDIIYLTSSLYTDNLELDEEQQTVISNKMCPIPVISKPYSNIVYNDETGAYALHLRHIRNLEVLELALTDASGVPLAINKDWYLTLLVEVCRDDAAATQQTLAALHSTGLEQVDLAKLALIGTAR